MKTDHIFKYLAATIIVGVALALVQPAHAAEGKERTKKRSGTYETSEGKSGTAEGTVTRSKGKKTREGSVTNQDGETATRKSERLRDKETGTDTYSSTTTAPGGKTATTNSTLTKTGEGTASTTGTRTGFNGQTSTYAGTVAKTEDGRTAAGMVTGQDGLTAERIIATRKNPDGTVTRTIQVTKPNGTTSTRSETVTVTADGKN
jgi:hypothetical protein